MKKSISYNAAAGMGIEEVIPYYWNGHEFITSCKVTFAPEIVEEESKKAMQHLINNGMAAGIWPDAYNFGIK